MLRKRIFEIIEKGNRDDKISLIFDWFIIILILLSIISVIIESYNPQHKLLKIILNSVEFFSVIVFTLEYGLRLITADLKYPNRHKILALLSYVFSIMALIDLAAILPFYLPMILHVDLRFLRVLRLVRILRVLKIQRYNNSFNIIKTVIMDKRRELLITVFTTFILLLLSSSIMYHVENEVQPDKFPNILESFWWGIATLTTVGYGDVFPITPLGKILSGVIALLGIGIVALPTGIISSGFIENISRDKNKTFEDEQDRAKYCKYCGKKIN